MVVITTLLFVNNKNKVFEKNEVKEIKQHIDTISMILETEAGSGNYEMTSRSEWPIDGYKFNPELSKCENGSELSWDDENKKVIMSGNLSDKCYVYFDIYVPTLAEYVISQYNGIQGNNNIYFHNSSLANGAGDNSYRYSGATPDNYVCFGSSDSTCPKENLYRIIGVFDGKVKLIKATPATSDLLGTDGGYDTSAYKWSNVNSCLSENTAFIENNKVMSLANKNIIAADKTTGCNIWKYSELNKTNLNTNYLNKIGITWSNMIENSTWKVSGLTTLEVTANVVFTTEITNATKTYGSSDGTSKVGLMYVSDY